jgi:MFS family permease
MKSQNIWNTHFILVCLGAFFLFFNFYILLSTLPLALQKNMGATAQSMSLVVSGYCFGLVALRPFSGMISDRYGKKRVSVLTFLLFSLCSVAYLGVDSILPLLAIRLLHGVAHSLSTTSNAALAIDMLPTARQGEGILSIIAEQSGYAVMYACVSVLVMITLFVYHTIEKRNPEAVVPVRTQV